jgi:predicted nucleotidyltransferase
VIDRAAAINEAVKRLVAFYKPLRIYLFGSSARGHARPDSDLDFLVVVPDDTPREKVIGGGIYRQLRGFPVPVEVVPFRITAFEERSSWLMSLPAIALREGRLVYDAAQVSG